jgi:hypothetical protein
MALIAEKLAEQHDITRKDALSLISYITGGRLGLNQTSTSARPPRIAAALLLTE